MKKLVWGFVFAVVAMLGLAMPAGAQYRAGLQGNVLDAQGAAVEGATVSLTSLDTNRALQVTTGSSGVYTFSSLAPGSYVVTVEKPGFKKKTLENVQILGEEIQALNISLEVGEVTATVTVNEAEAAPIDTESGQIGGTISKDEVQNLPSFGRDPFQLLRLAPGVFGDGAHNNGGDAQNIPGSAGPGGTSATSSIFQTENQVQAFAGGQRNEANSFQVDGVSVNSLDWGGAAIITPNEESVKEVQIISNSYDAEYGHGSGAQISVVSQNGTNNYHGSFFFKIDRPGLNSVQGYNGPGGPGADQRVDNRFNQFGGSVGGPVIKNRLFGFFSYETLRNNSISPGTAWVETPEFLTAAPAGSIANSLLSFPGEGASVISVLPSTCAQANLPATNCQPAGTGLDIGSPLTTPLGTKDPTFNGMATPAGIGNGLDGIPDIEFVSTANPNQSTSTQYNGRVDFQVTHSDLVTYSLYWVPNNATFFNGQARPANLWHSDRTNYSNALLWNHTFGPTLINEARFNVSRWYFNELATNPQEPFGLPSDTITGLGGLSNQIQFGANGPGIFYKTGYNIRDTVTKVFGQMSWRFGVDIYKEQNTQTQSGGARPSFNFNNLWDFANDAPVFEGGNFNPTTGVPTELTSYIRDNDIALFAQNNWKLKSNLTVNLGLRWEYFGPFHEKNGNLATTVLGPAPDQLTDMKIRLGGNLYTASKHNFGPQLGFAWSPTVFQNKFVVRGGFGLGYNRSEDSIPLNVLTDPSPLFASFGFNGSNIVYAVPSNPHQFTPYPANPNAVLTFNPATNLPVSGAPIAVNGLPSYLASPYTYRWSLEGQYDLGYNTVATLGYQGSASHRLLRWVFQGQILFEPQNPAVNNLRLFTDDVNGNYNALLTEIQHHFSHGFELDAQYTYSHSNDDASNNFYFDAFPFSAQAAHGPSDYDATHAFKVWGLYSPKFFNTGDWRQKVLGGWTFSGIYNFHSGFPWTPVYNVQVTGEPDGNGCSLLFDDSGYCTVRPAAYNGGAKGDFSNHAFEQPLGNFPNGPTNYFTPPALTTTAVPPVPGVGRNSFRGPRYSSLDFTAAKSFGLPNMRIIGENARIEVRMNFYNLLNEINLGPIGGTQTIGTIQLNSMTGVQTNPTQGNGLGNQTFDQSGFGLAGRVIEAQARFSF
jgi:Carboxypeptidase regulatory-like domain